MHSSRAPIGSEKEDGSGKKFVIRPYTPCSLPDAKGHFDLVGKVYLEGLKSRHIGGLKMTPWPEALNPAAQLMEVVHDNTQPAAIPSTSIACMWVPKTFMSRGNIGKARPSSESVNSSRGLRDILWTKMQRRGQHLCRALVKPLSSA